MNCYRCGAVIPNDARFCCYCGTNQIEQDKDHISDKLDQILELLKDKQPSAKIENESIKTRSTATVGVQYPLNPFVSLCVPRVNAISIAQSNTGGDICHEERTKNKG